MIELLNEYDVIFSELYAAQGFTTTHGTGKRVSHREIQEINARRLAKRDEIVERYYSVLTG